MSWIKWAAGLVLVDFIFIIIAVVMASSGLEGVSATPASSPGFNSSDPAFMSSGYNYSSADTQARMDTSFLSSISSFGGLPWWFNLILVSYNLILVSILLIALVRGIT